MAEVRRVEEADGRGDVRDVRIRNQSAAGMCGNLAGRLNPDQLMLPITVWRIKTDGT